MYILRKIAFKANEIEADFEQLGFPVVNQTHRENLEKIIKIFLQGYNIALKYYKSPKVVVEEINQRFDAHHVGFAFEGSGMWFAVMDLMFPQKQSRLRIFIETDLKAHDFIAAVGSGLAIGKVPFGIKRMERYMKKLHPSMAWCVPDGYAFYKGIFESKKYIDQAHELPANFPKYAKDVFDSGLGRSIWWAKCGSPELIKQAIDRFPTERRAELWSGIGVASTYAGGVEFEYLSKLSKLSGDYHIDYLSGIPFATRMRHEAGNYSKWTENACQMLLQSSTDELAELTKTLEQQLEKENDINDPEAFKIVYPLIRKGLKEIIRKKIKITGTTLKEA